MNSSFQVPLVFIALYRDNLYLSSRSCISVQAIQDSNESPISLDDQSNSKQFFITFLLKINKFNELNILQKGFYLYSAFIKCLIILEIKVPLNPLGDLETILPIT